MCGTQQVLSFTYLINYGDQQHLELVSVALYFIAACTANADRLLITMSKIKLKWKANVFKLCCYNTKLYSLYTLTPINNARFALIVCLGSQVEGYNMHVPVIVSATCIPKQWIVGTTCKTSSNNSADDKTADGEVRKGWCTVLSECTYVRINVFCFQTILLTCLSNLYFT